MAAEQPAGANRKKNSEIRWPTNITHTHTAPPQHRTHSHCAHALAFALRTGAAAKGREEKGKKKKKTKTSAAVRSARCPSECLIATRGESCSLCTRGECALLGRRREAHQCSAQPSSPLRSLSAAATAARPSVCLSRLSSCSRLHRIDALRLLQCAAHDAPQPWPPPPPAPHCRCRRPLPLPLPAARSTARPFCAVCWTRRRRRR